MKRFLTAIVLLLVLFSAETLTAQIAPLKVVATFSILGDLVHNVGGDQIDLAVLVAPDGDTHTYEPVPSDSVTLASAALIFEDGLGFETWLNDLYTASGSKAVRVVVTQGITPGTITVGDEAGETDPHVWQDVYNSIRMVEIIRDTLSQTDPANAVTYQMNANNYLVQLAQLDTEVLQKIATLPPDQRKLATDHDAFGYFANRYGFHIIGTALGSLSTETGDPSAAHIAQLIQDIKAAGAPAIFAENNTNPQIMQQIAQQAGVVVGPPLCSDALSPADGVCPTYVDFIRYNVTSIVGALSQ